MSTDDTPTMVRFQARRAQTAWEAAAELFQGNDYGLNVQAAIFITAGHFHVRMPQTAMYYARKSCDFVRAGNLRFVPTYGRPPEFSENLHETLVALSQTIYWVNVLFLLRGGPEPHATAELENEFRRELPVGGIASFTLSTEFISRYSEPIQFSSRSVL